MWPSFECHLSEVLWSMVGFSQALSIGRAPAPIEEGGHFTIDFSEFRVTPPLSTFENGKGETTFRS